MSIKNAEPVSDNPELERLRRKRDQEWELAGCARMDGDMKAMTQHNNAARDYQRQIAEIRRNE